MGESFTIQISSNLVSRLSEDGGKSKKKTKKPKPKTHAPQQSQNRAHEKQISDGFDKHKGTATPGWPLQPPIFLPVTPPPTVANAELDAIRSILQESQSVLERLQKQEENMVQEVTQRAKELRDKEFKLPYQKPMPCLAEKDACLECYKENTKDPLKCADVVKTFADCARRVRQQVSSPLG
ncbi:PREDICTED: MICOS complex subunit mic25a-like isoform X2 [Nelumbo nucifera]|nr:PREDICTED: MICOS complex subunit mic25a-like isoform X2 [Nelumbo nucifera]XP_010264185.1 PREDICTED: MICOS complex subunit mic25a-like isoform X2 [Nelumbo nucifera]DAD18605.1 TPA_asm: hypothetical protein HUJ06_020068 [Nelumbo nucifera]